MAAPASRSWSRTRTARIDADGRVWLDELEEKLGLQLLDERGSRRGRHAGRADLHPGRPGADPRRGGGPSGRPASSRCSTPTRAGSSACASVTGRRPADADVPAGPPRAACEPGSNAIPRSPRCSPALVDGGGAAAALLSAGACSGFGVLVAVLHRQRRARAGPSCAAPRSASASSWPGSTGSGSPSSPMPSASALYAVPAVLGLALFLALTVGARRRPGGACAAGDRSTAQALAFAVAWTLAEPLRGGLGLQFPWNPIASVWAVSDAIAAGGGLHRHLRPEPAHGRRGRPDRTPVPDGPERAARGGRRCRVLFACAVLGAGRAAPGAGAGRCRTPAFSCASSRPTWRSTTNGTPRSG